MTCSDRTFEQVNAVFADEIAPRLAAHLGGATVEGVDDDGVVHVSFTGACSQCSYRRNTILGAIYPRLREIEGVSGVAAPGVPVTLAEQRRFAATLDRYDRADATS